MPRRLRAEDIAAIALPQSPAISPDAETVVYAVKRMQLAENRYTSHLLRVPLRGGRPVRLTHGAHLDTSPCMSPDGRHVAFLSDRDGGTNVWLLPTDGGEARRLTSLTGAVARLTWRPDGRALLVVHRPDDRPDESTRAKRPTYKHVTRLSRKLDGDGWFSGARWHAYVVHVASGRVRQVTKGEFDVGDACFSPDGTHVAFVANLEPDADRWIDQSHLYVARAMGGRPKRVSRRGGPKLFVLWDGDALITAGHFGGPGEWIRHDMAIHEVRVRDGRQRALTKPLRSWPDNHTASDTAALGPAAPVVYEDGGAARLAFSVQEEGASHVYSIPRAGGRPRLELGGSVNVYGLSATRRGTCALAATTMRDAGDIYSLTLDGSRAAHRLTETNRAFFRRTRLTEPEEVKFASGRRRVHGWILKPPGFRKDRSYPMLLEIHGGPMAQYGYVFFFEMHLLAARGYVVVFSNPRGSSGYGTAWMKAIDRGRWGTVDYEDLMAVTDSMARKRYVDTHRMGVLGGSYGGYMTTHIVGRTRRFRAAVTQRQAGNRLIHFGMSDFGWYGAFATGGAMPWERPMRYLKLSPNYRAGDIRTPLLIIHSEQDHRCPIVEGEELFTFLEVQGKTVEMVAFEGESHGLSRGGKPQNRLERLRRILDWFDRYL